MVMFPYKFDLPDIFKFLGLLADDDSVPQMSRDVIDYEVVTI